MQVGKPRSEQHIWMSFLVWHLFALNSYNLVLACIAHSAIYQGHIIHVCSTRANVATRNLVGVSNWPCQSVDRVYPLLAMVTDVGFQTKKVRQRSNDNSSWWSWSTACNGAHWCTLREHVSRIRSPMLPIQPRSTWANGNIDLSFFCNNKWFGEKSIVHTGPVIVRGSSPTSLSS